MSYDNRVVHERLRLVAGSAQKLLRNRRFRLAAQILVISGSLLYLITRVNGVSDFVRGRQIGYVWLVWAVALTVLDVFIGALAWCLILRGFSQPVSLFEGARIHIYSNLAKYLPGYAWQLVGKAYSTSQLGVGPGTVGSGMAFELVDLMVLGLGLALSIGPEVVLPPGLRDAGWMMFLRVIGLLLIGGPFAVVLIASAFMERRPALGKIVKRPLVAAIILSLGGWFLLGFTFWLVGMAVQPISISALPFFISTVGISVIVGLAVVFVPGGIGVRESVMVLLLAPSVSAPTAVLIAVLSRAVLVLSDFAAALVLKGVQSFFTSAAAVHRIGNGS